MFAVYKMIASSSCGPRRSLSWRRPRKSSLLIRDPALAHGARPVEDHHWFLGEPGPHDLLEPPFRQTGQHFTHASNLSVSFRDSASYFPRFQEKVSASP